MPNDQRTTKMTPKFQYYEDKQGKHRWRLIAANGNIICDSAEGYENEADAKNGIQIVVGTNESTPIEWSHA